MRTRRPAVTAIIATYNWSEALPFSIGSVLLQSFTDFELLVVGDDCTDDSEKVVGAIGDSRVRWINLPSNTGHQSGPNNEGIKQARGEFIAYLGHDDLWLPHHLSCLVAALRAGFDLAYGGAALVPVDGIGRLATSGENYRRGMWIPPSSFVHRRDLLDRIGGWRDTRTLNADPENDLLQRAYDAGGRLTFVPRLTVAKFPALWRPDVYRDRPRHEQAAWLDRIRREPDLEAVELTRMLAATAPPQAERSFKRMMAMMFAEARRRLASMGDRFVSPARMRAREIDRRRAIKGLAHMEPLARAGGSEMLQPAAPQNLRNGDTGR